MDHILRVQVDHQSSAKHVARFTRSVDASLVTLALAAMAFLALFFSSSPFSVAGGSPSSSTLPARLVAVVGCILTSKTALFVLSNVIFALLAADCRCGFATTTTTTTASDVASSEPGGVLEKQAQLQQVQVQVQVQVEQCAVQTCVPCSESLDDHDEEEGEDKSTMSATASTLPDEELLSELELIRLGEVEEDSCVTLEETVDDVEEPACETAQGLDRLEIDELNKKFDEFIRIRRIKWVKEEAYLLLYEV